MTDQPKDKDEQTRLLDQFCRMDEFFADGPVPIDECEPGDHVFEVDGPMPGKCTFCGFTHKQQS